MRFYYIAINPMTYFTLLLKGAITVWLEIQAFWSLMGYYEKEPQKAG